LLKLARIDLRAISNMLDPEQFDNSIFGFHAQQAVEKALKSWLSLRNIGYPKTHDLRVLLRLLDAHSEAVPHRFIGLVDLTDFAVQFRYDFPILQEEFDRSGMLADAEAIVEHVEHLLQQGDSS
jgi:HEPN domain-containing protein